jgi:hypothetical protein
MSGIILKRQEFLVLLNAVRAESIIGIPSADLYPADKDKFKADVFGGIELLKGRGYLRLQGDIHVLSPDLLAMTMAMAYPQLVAITTRATDDSGAQLFLHYRTGSLAVEHTVPEENSHRLAVLPAAASLVDRIQVILSVQESNGPLVASVTVPQEAFVEAKTLSQEGDAKAALKSLKKASLSGEDAQLLVESLAKPALEGTVAMLQCRGGEVTGSRNAALVQGKQLAWLVTPANAEGTDLRIQTTTSGGLASLLQRWMTELAPAKA